MIKVLWGRDWDPLLAADKSGALVNKMNTTPDGQFQTYLVEDGAYIRNNFFADPRLQRMVANMSDEDIKVLSRGGHDYRKVYAAFKAATRARRPADGDPGPDRQGLDDRRAGGQERHPPDEEADHQGPQGVPRPALPGDPRRASSRTRTTRRTTTRARTTRRSSTCRSGARRSAATCPERRVKPTIIKLPGDEVYAPLMEPAGEKTKVATTQAFVRLLRDLMRDKEIGHRLVPIAPDEFRTFGMDSMFPTAKIYNPHGQTYESVDRKLLLSYKESEKGQLLHEGISEAGAMGSTIAAGAAYAMHGEPMIPVYIFYSMFGFQRTGDSIWAMADQLARGFLIGATAGRTTLTGEGLQHADGHSPLLASTNPAVVHYDPAFAYEIGHIVKDGLRRMYGHEDPDHPDGEDLIYYLTVYNEPVGQPGAPDHLDVEGLLKGMYRYAYSPLDGDKPRAQVLASGVAMTAALKAQRILADEWGVAADIWSVTSWNELRREAVEVEHWNLTHPGEERRWPYVTQALHGAPGPVVAVSDYMRAVQDQIAPWVQQPWYSLGTDGFGLADTRAAARRHFLVDAESIVVATLQSLARDGAYDARTRPARPSTATTSTTRRRWPAWPRKARAPRPCALSSPTASSSARAAPRRRPTDGCRRSASGRRRPGTPRPPRRPR